MNRSVPDQEQQDQPKGKCLECGGTEFERVERNPFSGAYADQTAWECTPCHKVWPKSDIEGLR